jgi:hypothetical protein
MGRRLYAASPGAPSLHLDRSGTLPFAMATRFVSPQASHAVNRIMDACRGEARRFHQLQQTQNCSEGRLLMSLAGGFF